MPTSTPQPQAVHELLARYDVDAPMLNLWLDVRDRLLTDHQASYQVLRDSFLAPASSGAARVVLPPAVPVADALPHADPVQAALRACGAGELDVQFEPVSQVEVGMVGLDC